MKILTQNSEEQSTLQQLVSKELPTHREAYSDRTCFICSCLSELVYLKFNEPIIKPSNKELVNKVTKLVSDEKISSLYKLIDLLAYDNNEEKEKLKKELKLLNLEIKELFDTKGTQAIIVSSKDFYFLVFRGTEPTSINDIKSDLKAKQIKCNTQGKIHQGFNEAFNIVKYEIQDYIDENCQDKPLLITGHSLGGALATVATKKLKHNQMAACYTFGSPRVGDEDWMLGIKTPVYRIVNSADPVTMLPPGAETMDALSFVIKFVPFVGDKVSEYFKKHFKDYSHTGYMRYLTNIENRDYGKARLLYSVSFLRRIRAYLLKKAPFSGIPADHSMSTYRKKMYHVAIQRNQEG
jgi:hypothetical protein